MRLLFYRSFHWHVLPNGRRSPNAPSSATARRTLHARYAEDPSTILSVARLAAAKTTTQKPTSQTTSFPFTPSTARSWNLTFATSSRATPDVTGRSMIALGSTFSACRPKTGGVSQNKPLTRAFILLVLPLQNPRSGGGSKSRRFRHRFRQCRRSNSLPRNA